jgi:hypothetical protein
MHYLIYLMLYVFLFFKAEYAANFLTLLFYQDEIHWNHSFCDLVFFELKCYSLFSSLASDNFNF